MRCHLILLTCIGALNACAPGPESAMGFRLPEGSADKGEEAFVALRCHACHDVEGLQLEYLATGPAMVTLGGEVTRVRTYGELVTSIINPSHKIAPGNPEEEVAVGGVSLMTLAYLNEVMTVQQLTDLVAFLQSRYEVRPPPYDGDWYLYP